MKKINLFSPEAVLESTAVAGLFRFVIPADTSLKIDWSMPHGPVKSLQIEIPTGAEVEITEVAGLEPVASSYLCLPESHLTYSLATFIQGVPVSADFEVQKASSISAGMADFAGNSDQIEILFRLTGKDAKVRWRLATVAEDGAHKEFKISFDHEVGDTYSMMENYGVCKNRGQLTFAGVSHIFPGADRSSAHQKAKIMVFDEQCIGKANPILRIDDNDVEASHAAAVGKVNEDHLFYLTSRGIDEATAKYLITLGYLNPVLSIFHDEKIHDWIANYIDRGALR